MKRKQFKRNVQTRRQRRSINYMQDRQQPERDSNLKHIIGGMVMGLLFVIILFEAFKIW